MTSDGELHCVYGTYGVGNGYGVLLVRKRRKYGSYNEEYRINFTLKGWKEGKCRYLEKYM